MVYVMLVLFPMLVICTRLSSCTLSVPSLDVSSTGMSQHPLLETDAAQQPPLFALGSMIFEVLAQVALVARLGNSLFDAWQFHTFQFVQFGYEPVVTFL